MAIITYELLWLYQIIQEIPNKLDQVNYTLNLLLRLNNSKGEHIIHFGRNNTQNLTSEEKKTILLW